MSDIITEVQDQIAEIARPLAARLHQLDLVVEERERELVELKKARTQLRSVVKGIDPSLVAEPKKKRDTNDWTPKAEKVAAMGAFLYDRKDKLNENGGFHAAGLTSGYPNELPIAYSTIHKVLAVLHDQGVIRLDSTGTGGAKFYKVVT